ncbi:hypothetical protein LOZ66_004065 [Ophidiomyces ophidiicola]|nr:hypothetical protein LOZ66_004065 [Ophidiomyces ophidiicola]
MAAKTLSLSELNKAMQQKDCLQGWDILVSYQTSVLNEILRQRASKIEGLTKVPEWPASWQDPITGDTVTSKVSISLSNPAINFKDDQASVTVTFSLSGESRREGSSAPDVLPPNMTLQLDTYLIDVRGAVIGSGAAAEITTSKGEGDPPSKISVFEPGTENSRAISIDFSSGKLTIVPGSDTPLSDEQAAFINCISVDIQEHFQKSVGLQCYLGSVSNKTSTDIPGALKPTAFSFSTIAGDSNTPGVLCMWIGVEGGAGNYTVPDQGNSLQFKIDTIEHNPIPKDHTASIIFSHQIMSNKFFLPALEASGMNGAVCDSVLGTPGMKFRFYLTSMELHVDKKDEHGSSLLATWRKKLDAVDFNMKDEMVSLEIGEKSSTNWSRSIRLNWSVYSNPTFGSAHTTHGELTLTFKIAKEGHWKLDGNKISFVIQFPDKFEVSAVADQHSFWEKFFDSASEDIPSEYKNLSLDIPVADMELRSMDYFLTTNLVFPGYTSFVPNSPDTGLAVPRDTIITGQIQTSGSATSFEIQSTKLEALKADATESLIPEIKADGDPITSITTRMLAEDVGAVEKSASELPEASQVAEKPASMLPKDLMNPKGTLFFDLTKVSMDKENSLKNVLSVVDQHGYGHITEAQVNQMLNVTTPGSQVTDSPVEKKSQAGRVLQQQQSNQTQLFSLNLFGGRYIFDGSSKELIVNPQTGRIKVDGVEAVPTFSTDPNTYITTTNWSVPSKTYSVVFSSHILDDDNFQPTFVGKMKDVIKNEEVDISGKKRILDTTDKGIISAKTSDIITIVGFSVGNTLSLIGLALAIRWRPKDKVHNDPTQPAQVRKENGEEANKLLERSYNVGEARRKASVELVEVLKKTSEKEAEARSHMAENENIFVTDVDKILEQESKRIQDHTKGIAVEELADGSGPAFETEVHKINDALKQRVEKYVQQSISPNINDSLMIWKKAGYITDAEIQKIATDGLKPLIDRQLADLTKKEAQQPSVAEAVVLHAAAEKVFKEQEAFYKDAEVAKDAAFTKERTLEKEYKKKEAAISKKEELKDKEQDPAEKKIMEDAIETMRKELKLKTEEHKAAAKEALEKVRIRDKEKLKLEKKNEKMEVEQKRKNEAIQRALKLKHH